MCCPNHNRSPLPRGGSGGCSPPETNDGRLATVNNHHFLEVLTHKRVIITDNMGHPILVLAIACAHRTMATFQLCRFEQTCSGIMFDSGPHISPSGKTGERRIIITVTSLTGVNTGLLIITTTLGPFNHYLITITTFILSFVLSLLLTVSLSLLLRLLC